MTAPTLAEQYVAERLQGFKDLPVGWLYGRGGPIPQSTIDRAALILDALRAWPAHEVFPSIDGSIMVCAYRDKACIDVTVHADGTYSIEVEP